MWWTIEKQMPLKRHTICLLLRLIVGGIFIAASYSKILDPAGFATAVSNYQMLPINIVNLFSVILSWTELFLGLCLIIGAWVPGAALLANTLFAAFFCALIVNLIRGVDISCGCFSNTPAENPNTIWYVIRDSIFLTLGSSLLYCIMNHKEGLNGR